MRVLVLNNAAPFIRGGAEELADQLVARLNATSGIEAELLRVPFRSEPADRIVEQILLSQSLRLYNVDRVIGLKFPTYLIPHPTKILWLLHQFRQAYDLYESEALIPLRLRVLVSGSHSLFTPPTESVFWKPRRFIRTRR